jgi:hypothetical protein
MRVADVQDLHCDPENAGAAFQAASQFNCLEMTGPAVTPEKGVGCYQYDRTQGPACAIACGGGTVWRNYFADVTDGKVERSGAGVGQTSEHQANCLIDLERALGLSDPPWTMRNGYALLTQSGMRQLEKVVPVDGDLRNELLGNLRVGVHEDVEVTVGGCDHRVTQVYASAMPVGYGDGTRLDWHTISRLVLDGAYEATLLAAAANSRRTGNPRVFLTLLGGGVFANDIDWIVHAVLRAQLRTRDLGLDVCVVCYGRPDPAVEELVRKVARSGRARAQPRATTDDAVVAGTAMAAKGPLMESMAHIVPSDGQDRRAYDRYPLIQEIEVVHEGRSLTALTEDISVGGACVFLEKAGRVRVGDTVSCSFSLPGLDEELRVEAQVRWVREGERQCVGLRFTEPLPPYVIFALF